MTSNSPTLSANGAAIPALGFEPDCYCAMCGYARAAPPKSAMKFRRVMPAPKFRTRQCSCTNEHSGKGRARPTDCSLKGWPMSQIGHKRTNHAGPKPTFVRCSPKSGHSAARASPYLTARLWVQTRVKRLRRPHVSNRSRNCSCCLIKLATS